jgi:hypothetical protein
MHQRRAAGAPRPRFNHPPLRRQFGPDGGSFHCFKSEDDVLISLQSEIGSMIAMGAIRLSTEAFNREAGARTMPTLLRETFDTLDTG